MKRERVSYGVVPGLFVTMSVYDLANEEAIRYFSGAVTAASDYQRRHICISGGFTMSFDNGHVESHGVGDIWPDDATLTAVENAAKMTINATADNSCYLCVHPTDKRDTRIVHTCETITTDVTREFSDCYVVVFAQGATPQLYACTPPRQLNLTAGMQIIVLNALLDPAPAA